MSKHDLADVIRTGEWPRCEHGSAPDAGVQQCPRTATTAIEITATSHGFYCHEHAAAFWSFVELVGSDDAQRKGCE